MTIEYPVRICRDPYTPEVHIRDASNRIIAAHLIGTIAQEIVDALNARAGDEETKAAEAFAEASVERQFLSLTK